MQQLKYIKESASFLKDKGFENAVAGIVLGTGLNALVNQMEIINNVPYNEIPHFPLSTVEYHKGQLLLGKILNRMVIIMQGRFHYYEGYSMQQITFPIRVLKELGIKYLLLSNAAGGINPDYRKADLVLTIDHINLLPENPLRGQNDPAFGVRFVDMSQPYDTNLNDIILKSADELDIKMREGVYAAVMGPNLETKAEYRYLRMIGADMVGMSTVPEVIIANQIGLPCAAVSVITDECDPDHLESVNIEEIIEVAGIGDWKLSKIIRRVIESYDAT